MHELSGIYAILDDSPGRETEALLDAILQAGVRIVQYRSKRGIDRHVLGGICSRAHAARAIVIVNDDVDAALDADGVHLGQEDLVRYDTASLRGRLGNRVLGVSCSTPLEAREAERLGADYVGVGPFKATMSKSDAGPAIGTAGIRSVAQATRLPVAAIGGIGLEDLGDLVRSGARMAAVISAIARAADPQASARALVQGWEALV